VQVP